MMSDVDKIAQDAIKIIANKIKNLHTLNIIVAGKTGVGKSTLINAIFREKLAETGMGKPVTRHMRKLTKKGVPLAIYDTRGFELGKEVQAEVKKEIVDTISQCLASQDINKAIQKASLLRVSELLSESKPFSGAEPEILNRHWAMHGRTRIKKTQADCEKLILFIYGLINTAENTIEEFS
jgi:GTP-binding protein EngB required for normal cell division